MYHEGYVVVQDQTLAKDWLSRAAANGHGDAINLLGFINTLLKTTMLVSQESYANLKERADLGDPHAQYELGLRYQTGAMDVQADPGKALLWLSKAADNGNLLAMQTLAKVYANGLLGMDKDPAKAAYWHEKMQGVHLKAGTAETAGGQ